MTPARLACEAEALLGTRFRLHGREPATGLDCIGLLVAALARGGQHIAVPTGYPLRLRELAQWLPDPDTCGFADAREPFRPGDVVMLQPGLAQFHLAIADRSLGWIHAHAGLRRVVREPALPNGTLTAHWRLRRIRK
jgi:cell wall-associated NlpC family hydrolase